MPRDVAAVPLDGWVDPVLLFGQREAAHPDAFWLDAGPEAQTGWSYLGTGARTTDASALRALPVGASAAHGEWPAGAFRGGWVGWLGYEEAAARAGAPIAGADGALDAGVPSQAWLRVDRFLAFDHAARRVWAVAPADEVGAWAVQAATRLAGASDAPSPVATIAAGVATRARHTPREYAELIARCHDAIRAGDAYQLCLTTRFDVETSEDPAAVYLRLRASSRSHHGGFLRIGDVSVLSASPEQFLRIEGDVVRTRPIKGTRPRDADPLVDAALAAELVASAKERAENVMIVDLMRNDLARVCRTGTVRVDALLAVESYPHVHQLVSTVSGHVRAGTALGDVLDRTFPAGSMTGAPKLSAMTILHTLEGGARGVFAGCFGWIGDDGDLDLAMVIRTIVMSGGGAYVGAGGGITWSSVADEEVREVGVKARAPLAALGADLPPGW